MYLRKSRADEELGYENTLERHEEMLRNLAAQTGIHVDEANIFREIVSGESIEARPQMQRLLKAVEMGLYKCQEVRDSKKTRTRSDQTLKNPFASIMFCSVCGKTMRRTHYDYKGERTFYYGCQTSRRVQKVNAARAELQARVEELEASIEESEERHEKAVPILTRVVEEMHTLTPNEQNDSLKMIIERIEYEKTESGAAIEPTLRISLKI